LCFLTAVWRNLVEVVLSREQNRFPNWSRSNGTTSLCSLSRKDRRNRSRFMFHKNVQCLALKSFPFPHLQEQPVLPWGFFHLVGQSHRKSVVVVWMRGWNPGFFPRFGITDSSLYDHLTYVPFELNICVWIIPRSIIFLNAVWRKKINFIKSKGFNLTSLFGVNMNVNLYLCKIELSIRI